MACILRKVWRQPKPAELGRRSLRRPCQCQAPIHACKDAWPADCQPHNHHRKPDCHPVQAPDCQPYDANRTITTANPTAIPSKLPTANPTNNPTKLPTAFGADPNIQDLDGDTAQSIALDDSDHRAVVDWLGATAGWPAVKIAAGCRLHDTMLTPVGWSTAAPSTPADCSLAELTTAGGTPANTLWPGSLIHSLTGAVRCDRGVGKSGHGELVTRSALAVPPRGAVKRADHTLDGASAPQPPRCCQYTDAASSNAATVLGADRAAHRAVAGGVQLLPLFGLGGLAGAGGARVVTRRIVIGRTTHSNVHLPDRENKVSTLRPGYEVQYCTWYADFLCD